LFYDSEITQWAFRWASGFVYGPAIFLIVAIFAILFFIMYLIRARYPVISRLCYAIPLGLAAVGVVCSLHNSEEMQMLFNWTAFIVDGVVISAVTAVCTTLLFFVPRIQNKYPIISQLRNGMLFGLIGIGLVGCCMTMMNHYGINIIFPPGTGVGAGIGLCSAVFIIFRRLEIGLTSLILLLTISILIAFTGWYLSWLPIALLCMLLARSNRSLPLLGLGTAFLALMICLEYYRLSSTLLMKSVYLLSIGVGGIVISGFISYALIQSVKSGKLPVPMALLHGETAVSAPDSDLPMDIVSIVRKATLVVTVAAFFVFFGFAVNSREDILTNGTVMVLKIAPKDPRSLMQGDYMTVRFEMAEDIERAIADELTPNEKIPKTVIVALDDKRNASFVRLETDRLPLKIGEYRLKFRVSNNEVKLASGSFFFQEGTGYYYETAEYARLIVNEDGTAIITHLLDEEAQYISGAPLQLSQDEFD
jgi:uncharacterized membrane-anchored protein